MTNSPNLYRAFGLHVLSPWPLPGAIAHSLPHPETAPDILIEQGSATLPESATTLGPYRTANGELLLEWPELGRVHFHPGGHRLTAELSTAGEEDEFSARLIATALPAALWQRGDFVLHAGCAILPESTHAVAFAGVSGAGKSALLKELLAAGASLVAEDATRLSFTDGGITVSGLPGCLHLRQPGEALHAPRTTVLVPQAQQVDTAQLGAIVVLEADEQPASHKLLSATDAIASLLTHRHRPAVPQALGTLRQGLQQAAEIAQALPVYCWKGQSNVLWNTSGLDWFRSLPDNRK